MDKQDVSTKVILVIIGLGIWVNVLQTGGIIPSKQDVHVKGGYLNVSGSVDIDNSVDVSGYMDVNVAAINGKSNAFYDFAGNGEHVRIPVYTGY